MSGESLQGAPQPAAPLDPFFGSVLWTRGDAIGEFAADTPLERALARVEKLALVWAVVVVRGPSAPSYYAIGIEEIFKVARQQPERLSWPLDRALELDRRVPGVLLRGGPPRDPGATAGALIVEVDAAGRVLAVGEPHKSPHVAMARPAPTRAAPPHRMPPAAPSQPPGGESSHGEPAAAPFREAAAAPDFEPTADEGDRLDDLPDLGPMRGGREPPSPVHTTRAKPPERPPGPGEIEVTVSAEAPAELDVGATGRVPFQIELTSEAIPLAQASTAVARTDVPIVVALSVENDALEVLNGHERTVDPPRPGQPRSGFFGIKAVRPGACRIAAAFRQGGSDLAVIGLDVEVRAAGARADATSQGKAVAAPRDATDDDKLALLVEQRVEGGQVFYEYTLHSEALGLPYRRVRSRPLLDSGGGPAATAVAFVKRIYDRVTRELKSRDDIEQLQREARGLGATLCEELLDPEVAKLLWPLRDRLRLVQIVSWEPYIPWELVRLRDPDSGDIDDRFLCQYGLVRTLSDEMPTRELALSRWSYLAANFPLGSFPAVGAELDYFTASTPDTLRGHGIEPRSIEPTRNAFYKALGEGDFDVLHIACHAESEHESIEQANLIIGDEARPGESRPALVEVDTVTVSAEAKLRARRPLVFLNACETGRAGAVLTAWGGWPNVFLRRGAGAFVGTSWAVREKPAAAFATAFYNALMDGATLAEAATGARAAAQRFGDASWLAFKVYGHPRARKTFAPGRQLVG